MPEASSSISDQEPTSFMPQDNTPPRSHRAVDALRQSPVVELHRSSSGRNLRLKQLSLADGALLSAPNALTPRAPSGRRPERRERLHSSEYNNREPTSNNDRILQRSSSFSISAHVLKDLERVTSSTDPVGLAELCERPERPRRHTARREDQQQREDSSDETEKINWNPNEETSFNNSEVFEQVIQEQEAQIENRAVSSFGLWGKAAKSKSLPDAIIFSCSNTPTPSEMVSQLHVTHPHLAALSVLDMPKSMSLTRSTSPRIRRPGAGAAFSSLPEVSLRQRTTPPTNNQQLETETDTSSSVEVSNPITQWKRGELIGEGTFGKVYKGLNIATGELFALKEIEIHSRPNDDQVTQMQKLGEEISLMNNLSHKHIVRYKGSYRSENHFYIFMEYVPGGSIASMLKQFDAFSEDLIRIFTRQIVQGVAYLHEMGIIHRDIKGANVLVNEQGVSKLADFGCSKQIPQMLTTSLEESLRSIRGSIPWMAPEVVKQIGHGYKADIWSIGATVIEMATAKHPWPNCHNGLAAMYTIAMATAPPLLPEHLSSEAKSFLQRCFCIDPEERATALELVAHAFLAEKK
ncbi:mitogen-activated protein kinase kinase kinase, putative [Phytophthora infestans T30-4]|uniref:Mitogen-activated protein kinase kinase kinase, putative n=1 Tax=Phytophthora infestans (strain T30-4) TaxID=403677 RepID=D0P3A1_PHYIT|nr:mitogen-activated protein kinase kinase kinase, putative [Phytophthora infestans T30-4]EEY59283.1 mitogen-activated protein kinase kinase kinase, putative [Phytophthora infestans T30-4]|eukprot:XP_002895231.1 mitogen-activated protein kinase kinase kinase, putative [Phytophthora infestans T30-4]